MLCWTNTGSGGSHPAYGMNDSVRFSSPPINSPLTISTTLTVQISWKAISRPEQACHTSVRLLWESKRERGTWFHYQWMWSSREFVPFCASNTPGRCSGQGSCLQPCYTGSFMCRNLVLFPLWNQRNCKLTLALSPNSCINYWYSCKIWCFYSGNNEERSLLGHDAVWFL